MEIGRLRTFLRRHRRIALDTSVFIYQFEADARYIGLTEPIFEWLERPQSKAVTSTITMTEMLVQPYRQADEQRVDEFYARLSTYPHLDWIAPNLQIADLTARFRGEHRLRTPDAIVAATAVHAHASGLITNDSIFERVPGFETLVLESLL